MQGRLLVYGGNSHHFSGHCFSFALRTFQHGFFRKLGAFGFLAATFLIGFFASGLVWVGLALAFLWFLFPWIELLTRTRKLRLPVKRTLERQAPPGSQRCPELGELTEEIEEKGFEYVSDTGWKWEDTRQFFRFFYHDEKRAQATICFTEQVHFSWVSISVTTKHRDGRVFRSTNVPFSNPMKLSPHVFLRRDVDSLNFDDFLGRHLDWLDRLAFREDDLAEQSPDEFLAEAEEESGRQINHNVESGIIALCEKADTWRYSWRGLVYLYVQVVKDFLRWC